MSDLAAATARYLDGVATPDERALLLTALHADPQALAQFRQDLRMHLALTSMLQPDDSRAIAAMIADLRPAVPSGSTERLIVALRPRVRERGVIRRRTRVRWLAVAAAACLALGILLAWPAAPVGTIGSLSGPVSLLRGGATVTVASGMPLRRGDLLTTGLLGRVAWHEAEGAELTLAAGSVQLVASGDGALRLLAGVLQAQVESRPTGRPPYRIVTPDGEAQVLGTTFTLRVDERGTRLEVEHGRVRLSQAGVASAVEVGPGEGAAVTPAGLEPPRPLATPRVTPRHPSVGPEFRLVQQSATHPSVLAWGQAVAESADPDGWCLQAVNYADNLEVYLEHAGAAAAQSLLTAPENGYLSFRYLIDSAGDPLCLYSQNQTTGTSVSAVIQPTTFGSWALARIPLSSFVGANGVEPGIRPGDTLKNLIITANPPTPGRSLRVDDIVCGSSGSIPSTVTP